MNIAFPAVLLFLIALPGFIYRSRLKRVDAQSLDYSPFGNVATEGVFYAAALHGCALYVTYSLLGRSVRFDLLLHLLTSQGTLTPDDYTALSDSVPWIAEYSVGVFVPAFLVPTIFRAVVTRLQLDRAGSVMAGLCRFHRAPWYYLLSSADFKPEERKDLVISIAAIVNIAGEPYLYHGYLSEFYTTRDGTLDRVVLTNTQRRKLDHDRDLKDVTASATAPGQKNDRFYPIAGNYFVLRYSEMITLNVHYFSVSGMNS